jgi:hypothetical protein
METELSADHRKRFAGIVCVVGEQGSTHPVRLFLSPNTAYVGMLGRLMGRMKDRDGTRTGGHDLAGREPNPLITVLTQELVADRPVSCFVLTPLRMDLLSNLRGQSVSQAFHQRPRVNPRAVDILPPPDPAVERCIGYMALPCTKLILAPCFYPSKTPSPNHPAKLDALQTMADV